MIINGTDFPNIGRIRAKKLPGTVPLWELTIHPPTQGPLQGHEPASFVEVVVEQVEAERIERAAPHLMSGVLPQSEPDRARLGIWPKKRAGKA